MQKSPQINKVMARPTCEENKEIETTGVNGIIIASSGPESDS